MATTITVQNTIDYAQCFNQFRPMNIGANDQPVITAANLLLMTILSPPFAWNWNRNSVSFLTTIGVQDYAIPAPTFGFIEKASWVPAANIINVTVLNNVATYETEQPLGPAFVAGAFVTVTGCVSSIYNVNLAQITSVSPNSFSVATTLSAGSQIQSPTAVAINGSRTEISQMMNVLGDGNEQGTPANISPQIDNNEGTITFRTLPLPDQIYQIVIIFQNRIPALISGLSNTWAPIPDHYSHIYQWGFTAMMLAYSGNPMWQQFNSKFVTSLLGVAEGLSQEQKNIFQATWLASLTEISSTAQKAQMGNQAKGV